MKHPYLVFLLVFAISLSGCRFTPRDKSPVTTELRGVWVSYLDIATLLKDTDTTTAATRIDTLMDTCRDNNMNTVFFHVRAYSDAYYPSAIFRTATAVAHLVENGFDPLSHAVASAHRRGLQLHAWINPYRIGKDKSFAVTSEQRAIFSKDGEWYYSPSHADARRCVLDGVREILDNYAVDGIHFDDYFYPHGMPPSAQPFEENLPDEEIADRRRYHVDTLISSVHGLTRARSRTFGVSPTALINQNRENAYADVALWMKRGGYVDYVCPQLYFGFEHTTNPFADTLALWESLERHDSVALYIGLALYKAGTRDPFAGDGEYEWCQQSDVIARQIKLIRQRQQASGFVLFRYEHLTAARKEMSSLKNEL